MSFFFLTVFVHNPCPASAACRHRCIFGNLVTPPAAPLCSAFMDTQRKWRMVYRHRLFHPGHAPACGTGRAGRSCAGGIGGHVFTTILPSSGNLNNHLIYTTIDLQNQQNLPSPSQIFATILQVRQTPSAQCARSGLQSSHQLVT